MFERILFFVLAAGGVWLTLGLWDERQTYIDLENWPTVMAQVVKLEEFEEDWERDYGPDYKMYSIQLEYRYDVAGETYSGNQLSASGDQMRWYSLDDMLAETVPFFYDRGETVEIAYHPENPETSLAIICDRSLEAAPTYSWISIMMSGGFSAFCGLMFIGSLMPDPDQ